MLSCLMKQRAYRWAEGLLRFECRARRVPVVLMVVIMNHLADSFYLFLLFFVGVAPVRSYDE